MQKPHSFVYKTLNHVAPSYMSDIITVSTHINYSLHKDLVLKHKPKTKYIKDSFNHYSRAAWNEIPIEIRNAANINSFKYLYKKYLMNMT